MTRTCVLYLSREQETIVTKQGDVANMLATVITLGQLLLELTEVDSLTVPSTDQGRLSNNIQMVKVGGPNKSLCVDIAYGSRKV